MGLSSRETQLEKIMMEEQGLPSDIEIKVAKLLGKTIDEFYRWCQDFEPKRVFAVSESGVPCCVWTDGDQGALLFKGYCDIFDEAGCEISSVWNFCDMDYGQLDEIMWELTAKAAIHFKRQQSDPQYEFYEPV